MLLALEGKYACVVNLEMALLLGIWVFEVVRNVLEGDMRLREAFLVVLDHGIGEVLLSGDPLAEGLAAFLMLL